MFGISSFAEFAFGESTHQPVNLEGIQATISLGNISAIEANADVTLGTNVNNISIGDLTFIGAANVTVSGNAVTSSLGSMTPKAAADVAVTTNLAGTVAVGSVTIVAKAVVVPGTNLLTSSVNGPGVVTWNDIDVNASQTWTNVET
jgi:hypothetical protein|tara:strand:+ start:549 stop:986 length:438 start_codon:yes stop_codon:yes gene_type:complete